MVNSSTWSNGDTSPLLSLMKSRCRRRVSSAVSMELSAQLLKLAFAVSSSACNCCKSSAMAVRCPNEV